MRYVAAIIASLLFGTVAAHAAHTTATVNCRSKPATNGPIVARIERGAEVRIMSRLGTWALVDRTKAGCWVASRYLADAAASTGSTYDVSPTYRTTRQSAAKVHTSRRSSTANLFPRTRHSLRRSSRRSGGSSYGGSCPCSGSNICIGPRGGRYCITSGGNKRYGV